MDDGSQLEDMICIMQMIRQAQAAGVPGPAEGDPEDVPAEDAGSEPTQAVNKAKRFFGILAGN